MSKYVYRILPDEVDLVDDVGYDEEYLDSLTLETVYEIAKVELSDPRVRRV